MGKKLRKKDYHTGYEQGFKDALKYALKTVDREIDSYNKEVKNEKEYSSC